MTRIPLEPALTSTQARAAAAAYGWSVLPHDNGGFFAQCGQHRMVVTFAPDGSFRAADVREERNEVAMALMEGAVVGELARRGNALRPVGSEEKAP